VIVAYVVPTAGSGVVAVRRSFTRSVPSTTNSFVGAASPGPGDLVIQGQFLRIDEGSVTKRFVIGLGAGATEVRTQVEMFHVTDSGWWPVKRFDTVAQGKRLPGAGFFVAGGAVAGTVATTAVISSGVGVVREIFASVDADARRTAEQIAAQVSQMKTAQGW